MLPSHNKHPLSRNETVFSFLFTKNIESSEEYFITVMEYVSANFKVKFITSYLLIGLYHNILELLCDVFFCKSPVSSKKKCSLMIDPFNFVN